MLMFIKKENRLFRNWEIILWVIATIVLIIAVILEFIAKTFLDEYPTMVSVITGLFGGLFATFFVLYFERQHRKAKLKDYYKRIVGKYVRYDIGQDNTPRTLSSDMDVNGLVHPSEIPKEELNMQTENRKLKIELKYEGENNFSVKAEYWYSLEAFVEAQVEFNESNKAVAHGRYWYTKGKLLKGHFGTYTIYRFAEDDSRLLVLFQHVFPREVANNPDNNRGWEIWVKYPDK